MLNDVSAEPDPRSECNCGPKANRRYLVRVVHGANTRIEELIKANIKGTKDALTLAYAQLSEAQTALAEGRLGAARKCYQDAVKAARAARGPLRTPGLQMGKSAAAGADAPGSGAELPPSIIVQAIGSVWPLPLGHDVTLKQVTSQIADI